jgi:hypothetical protein
MRVSMSRCLFPAVVGLVLVAGCGGNDPPPEPIPTDGPNQVVVFVPSMT